MAKVISSFLIVALFSLMSNFANADSFGITLRYWLTEESIPGATEFIDIELPIGSIFVATAIEGERTEIPAVTLRWSPDAWENHDILLSFFALDPERKANSLIAMPSILGSDPEFRQADIQTERSDFELLVRSRAREIYSIYYGLRVIDAEVDIDTLTDPLSQRVLVDQKWTLAEGGLGVSVPVSESGRHSLFANAVVGVGRFEQDEASFALDGSVVNMETTSGTGSTIDLNFGYQYTMNQTASFSLRYRDWSSFIDGEEEIGSAGIELGLSLNF